MRTNAWKVALALVVLVAAGVCLAGINWGLPSREADRYLFDSRPVWEGKQIIELAGGWEANPNVGADVALNPLADRERVLVLNDTDAKRAEIVRRYRLFSYQPDEMITLRALAGMKPAKLQLDPKLYQYGGLWIYPVGGLLQVASRVGFVQLRGDVAYYLDHPEQFGRFYIVARFYTMLWALVGVVTVYAMVRQIVGGWVYPTLAAACFIFMPVVMNMAHEAKPHLPGAVLMLLAVWAGARYVESGKWKWWALAGALCGAALGMVLSSLPIFVILPVMVLLRKSSWRDMVRVLIASGAIGAGVYLITNPYIPINLLHNREVLRSNFGNSTAMYHAQLTAAGTGNALKLIAVGTAPLLALAGAIGAVVLGLRAWRVRKEQSAAEVRRRAVGLLLAIPALWVVGQCISVATGKPGEFGRFTIFPDTVLMIEAVVGIATFVRRPAWAGTLAAVLFVTTAIPGALYLRGFVRDSRPPTPRLMLADQLEQLREHGAASLAVFAEPAPYCQPPVDLWRWKIELMPRGAAFEQGTEVADVAIQTVDVPPGRGAWGWIFGTPISWADKPFQISIRQDKAYRHR